MDFCIIHKIKPAGSVSGFDHFQLMTNRALALLASQCVKIHWSRHFIIEDTENNMLILKHLPLIILVLFLDLCCIFVNLPVKSLGSNISSDREAIRSRTIPSWPCFCCSRSWCSSWTAEWPLQWSELQLSATRLVVLLLTSSRDMVALLKFTFVSHLRW